MEQGNFSNVEGVGAGVYELKIDFGPGYRVYSEGRNVQVALTREFRATTLARARRDPAFGRALLVEAVNAYLGGEEAAGKAILRVVQQKVGVRLKVRAA